jgi:hypothetical protein
MTPWSAPISGSFSGRSLIQVYPQLGAGGAVDILEYVLGGRLHTFPADRAISRASRPSRRLSVDLQALDSIKYGVVLICRLQNVWQRLAPDLAKDV